MVVLKSFVPSSGEVISVTVYPSEFGKSRMREVEPSLPFSHSHYLFIGGREGAWEISANECGGGGG